MRFDTIAVRAGGEVDESTGAVAPPIHLSTTFEMTAESEVPRGYRYVRESNPTQSRLEEALAAIEGAEAALVFGSGMAAGAAIAQALPPRSKIVLTDDSYYSYRILAGDFATRWGVDHSIVDFADHDAVARAIEGDRCVVWAESPSNPMMKVVDLRALATLAHARGAMFLVDNTFATPALQQPIALGADIVLQSTTKYLGGHSDVQGGALMFRRREDFFARVEHARRVLGAVASPFNSWLVLRGIRSLAARMRVHSENGQHVAEFLEQHPAVARVHYPGLPSHPGHEIAKSQMSAFGGMISFQVRGGREAAIKVVSSTRLFTTATSLGGTESLIEHRSSSEGEHSTTPADLVRLSIGLEHYEDLIADLQQALDGA